MNKELRWRVVYGYRPHEYISIDEKFLEKAKYSMLSGKLFNYKTQTVRGTRIDRIEPDFRFYTGWADTYQYGGGEDQIQIERDVPIHELESRSVVADSRVRYVLQNKNPQLLNDITGVDKLLLA